MPEIIVLFFLLAGFVFLAFPFFLTMYLTSRMQENTEKICSELRIFLKALLLQQKELQKMDPTGSQTISENSSASASSLVPPSAETSVSAHSQTVQTPPEVTPFPKETLSEELLHANSVPVSDTISECTSKPAGSPQTPETSVSPLSSPIPCASSSPVQAPASPVLTPTSPVLTPTSPVQAPASPVLTPTGPAPSAKPHSTASKSYSVNAPQQEMSRGWNWFWYGREELHENENREFIMASNWLIRFGMLVLVLGLGFFVKYSIDQGWLSPQIRILGTTLVGLAMYFGGLRLWHTTLNLLGQALIAGSTCVLYFSAYGASRLYSLIPQEWGLAWCCAVTLALVLTAIRRESRLIAVLGMLGAYLTPYFFPFFRENFVFLAVYLSFPTLGILWMRRAHSWSLPAWIAFAGTLMLWVYPSFGWNTGTIVQMGVELQMTPLFLQTFLAGISIFFLAAFHLIAQRRVRQLVFSSTAGDLVLAFFNALFFCTMLQNLLTMWDPGISLFGIPHTSAIRTLPALLAFGYLLAFFLLKRTEQNLPFRAADLALAFLVFPLTLGNSLGYWNLPCLLLICAAFHSASQKIPSNLTTWLVRVLAMLLGIAAYFALLEYYQVQNFSALLGKAYAFREFQDQWDCLQELPIRALRFLIPGISMLVLAGSAFRARENANISNSLGTAKVFGTLGLLYLWGWLTLETSLCMTEYLPSMRQGAVSIVWSLFALMLLSTGIRWNWKPIRTAAHLLFALTVGKIFLVDISRLETIYRISAFILLGILLLIGGTLYLRNLQEHGKKESGAGTKPDMRSDPKPGPETQAEAKK